MTKMQQEPYVYDFTSGGVAANARPELDAIYRKIGWRLLPFLLLCYVLAYLDRVNVGFAKLQMQADVGFSDVVYGLGAGMFFIGYLIFEVPSNLLLVLVLVRVGVRRIISRIMVLWGLTSAGMLFVQGEWGFYVLRFLLGVFEAGFFPGVIFYLTCWYTHKRIAVVMCAGPIGGAFGGPLSTWIMTRFDGTAGMQGWQWMFLLEGLPCVLLGVIAFFYLVDRPEDARWLSAREKKLLADDLSSQGCKKDTYLFREVLRDKRVYALAATYFTLVCAIYAVSFWLPTLLQSKGVSDIMQIGLYSALPYLLAIVAMVWLARRSDRLEERRWHIAGSLLAASLAFCLATIFPQPFVFSMSMIALATALIAGATAVFWALPSRYLKGEAADGGIALINSIGALGGFVSPSIIGWIKTATGSFSMALYGLAALLVIGAMPILFIRHARS